MTEVREDVVAELDHESEVITLQDFVRIIEAHHATEGRGVSRELVGEYADAVRYDVDLDALDDRTTDSDEWREGGRFYELRDGRISVYPPDWHETMSSTDDIRDVVEIIQSEVTAAEGDMWEAVSEQRGVPEEKVFHVGEVVAGIDRDDARDRIKELRDNGEIEEFASQHRNPTIKLT
ncbi:hypothetical protein [Halorussus sp. MSC15.2]|uniref:hypothetical protein n=1 Tax=Halorussus sp. MSC15.2 TaxID=2283638 RepID=UPI0013D229FA|nr:hypothetical protein [Halorussus sp. MSC15.2]NEU58975.1 hypothetical protein [Halorussus sp. MSC15.2]